MVEDAARDNLRYLEVRYCPELSRRQGLTLGQVIEAELRGLARGERDFGVVARVINCSLRHFDPAISLELAECSVAFKNRGLLGITIHAGEAAGVDSIAEAMTLCHANRIGHGTRLHESPELQSYLRDRR